MAKVYVSSTIADLKRERRAVLDWLRAARHQAVDSYLPDSDTVRDSCLDDVGTCDLYVLIVGHRYGFQPAEDNPEGCRSRSWSSGGPVSAASRGWRCCAPAFPTCSLSDLADPAAAGAGVWRSGMRSPAQVRPAEFSDLQGLIQGLSTGVQGELDKLAPAAGQAAGERRAGCCGWRRGRCSWPGGRSCWPSWMPGWPAVTVPGRGWWRCAGWAGRARPAWRWSTRTVTWPRSGWPGSSPAEDPAVLAAGFGELAAQLGARGRPIAGTRWRRCTGCWPPSRRRGCWCSTTRRTGPRWQAFVPPAGRGRVLITSRNPIWPPGQALEVPVLDPRGRRGVPGRPHR